MTTVIITGTRHANWAQHHRTILAALRALPAPLHLVHGAGRGVDTIADRLAQEWSWRTSAIPADWLECGPECPPTGHQRYCPQAGPRRNQLMIDRHGPEAGGVLAFPARTRSPGTWDLIRRATQAGLHIRIHPLEVPQ